MMPANEDDFISKFRTAVLAESEDTLPSDFQALTSSPLVLAGGASTRSLTTEDVPNFLDGLSPPVPPELHAQLTSSIPALMFAGTAHIGFMTYQHFTVGDQGELQVAYVATLVKSKVAGDSQRQRSALAIVYGNARAVITQQYSKWHQGCCSCRIFGCHTFFLGIGCHGCDHWVAVGDTPEQVAHIKQGLRAGLHQRFLADFPIKLVHPVGALQLSPSGLWSSLVTMLRTFVDSPETRAMVSRECNDSTVKTVQVELQDISSMVNVLKIPQVLLFQVPLFFARIAVDQHIPQRVVERLQAGVDGAAMNETWVQIDAMHSEGAPGAYMTYLTVFLRRSPHCRDEAIDLVVASYREYMCLDNLTIVTSSRYSINGSVQTTIVEERAPITGDSLRQFEVQWKYAADRAILRSLVNAPLVSAAVRAPFANQLPPLDLFSFGSAFTGLKKIISLSASLWTSVVSAFGSHTSQKISIISQHGFSKLNEITTVQAVPFVPTVHTGPFIDAAMSEYSAETRSRVKASLMALQFSNSTTDDSVWLREQVTFNKKRSAGGCGSGRGCAELFVAHLHPLPAQGANHWSLCTYGLDFTLAPTLELISVSKSSLFGLFKDSDDELREIPASFTPEDENHLRQFMAMQCQYSTGRALGMHNLKPPLFPS